MEKTKIATKSLHKGRGKLWMNQAERDRDCKDCGDVVAEGIKTILRREADPSPYEALKALTRTNAAITGDSIARFIDRLEVSEAVHAELRAIPPTNYPRFTQDNFFKRLL